MTDYVREKKRKTKEVFVPLWHAPGHAQADFGDRVHIRGDTPPGHIRTPYYIRGKSDSVVNAQAASDNPEECPKGLYNEPKQPLYRVRFMQTETWPDYRGNPDDTLDIEIFQHWL